MKRTVKALIIALVIGAIAFYFDHRNSFLNISNQDKPTLVSPESVRAAHTVGFVRNTNQSNDPDPQLFYEKDTNTVVVPEAVAARVVEIITSKERQSDLHPACIYTPGYVMTFVREGKSIDIFFCFECGGIIMKSSSESIPKEIGLITNSHRELFAIFQKLFPGDAAVTSKP